MTMRSNTLGRTLMDRSVPGRGGVRLPGLDVPAQPPPDEGLLRRDLPLPELAEPDVVRYFTHLSQANFSVDTNFYPLGSCTMKYNPKVNDELASIPGFAGLHPLQGPESTQGALELMHRLQDYLCQITGLPGCSLATLAGAHGELAGVLMTQAYHRSRGEDGRKVILIPDSAHGTNPASASMAGYEVVEVPSTARGELDLEALRRAATPELAGLMITLPSTLGLFNPNIAEICRIVHEAGGLVYGDGANMNALLGQVKLGELGFDILHLNLHKTMSTPHGGGGPGAGPVCVADRLLPFLPTPVVERGGEAGDAYGLARPARTIGAIGGFHGNFGCCCEPTPTSGPWARRAFDRPAKTRCSTPTTFAWASRTSTTSPTTASACTRWSSPHGDRRPRGAGDGRGQAPHRLRHPPADDVLPAHRRRGADDRADETESLETLDTFIEAMRSIAREVEEEPHLLADAPHGTPVGRLDEARAARQPDLRWRATER